jgi:hypothetical protein
MQDPKVRQFRAELSRLIERWRIELIAWVLLMLSSLMIIVILPSIRPGWGIALIPAIPCLGILVMMILITREANR